MLTVLINLFMLLVWALCFQLLLNAHRRQRRAKILINRSGGHDLGARCLVSNMGAEAIYIEAVIVECDTDRSGQVSLTSLDTIAREPDGDPRRSWFQGPLQPGELISLGNFKDCSKQP